MLRPYTTDSPTIRFVYRIPVCRRCRDGRYRWCALWPRGCLEVVHEGAHDAALHQSRRGGGHTFVIEGTRCRAVRPQRSSLIERRVSNTCSPTLAASGELPCKTVLPERPARSADDGGEAPRREHDGNAPSGGVTIVSAGSSRVFDRPHQRVEVGVGGRSPPTYWS